MSHVLMAGCAAGGNVILSLDDHSFFRDEGEEFEPFALTGPIDFKGVTMGGRLRYVAQAVTIGAAATVTITPYADGDEFDEQAVSAILDPAMGTTQIVEAEPAVDGDRFAYKMAVSDFAGPVEFGQADLAMVPKRT